MEATIMADRNGYFRVRSSEEGTFLKLFPAQDNGEPLKIDEVLEYLTKHEIKFELSRVKYAVGSLSKEVELNLSSKKIPTIREEMCVKVSADNMQVTARFYPPSNDTAYIGKEELLRALSYQGIQYGILEKEVDAFIQKREYCKDYVFAKGTPLVEGKDAEIHYFFNLRPNAKPKLNTDGSVNFHDLDNINRIKAGDVLATLEKEKCGTVGTNVYGVQIVPKTVKSTYLKYGKGVTLSEDQLSLIAEMDGHVQLTFDEKVVVANTYIVEENVDVSTGNIRYDGNVQVKGHVCSGFTIIASGDVEIEGVVEGAKIIAQGQIILKRGIQGMGKGVLQSQGAIIAKFIESASVLTNGSITTESILHSQVSAKEGIYVSGKKGLIVVGHVRSAILIETQVAGSAMGGNTILEVGVDPIMQSRMETLEAERRQLEANREKAGKMIDVYKIKKKRGQLTIDKAVEFQKTLQEYSETEKRLTQIDSELDRMYECMNGVKDARIKVWKDVHPGVKLVIDEEVFYVMSTEHHCQFYVGKDRLIKRSPC